MDITTKFQFQFQFNLNLIEQNRKIEVFFMYVLVNACNLIQGGTRLQMLESVENVKRAAFK